MLSVVMGHDKEVGEWAGSVGGVRFVPPFSALGIVDETGVLKGAAVFNDYYPGGNVEMGYYGPGTITPSVTRSLALFAFKTLNASRVTFKVRKSNVLVRKMLGEKRHGFEYEGTRKRYLDTTPNGDVLSFVLFRHKASRWLN